MIDRQFDEMDLRVMLEDASEYMPGTVAGRWRIETELNGKAWIIILEPDFELQCLVVITAYMVE